jgi:CubicO group peptidase (beta-lactamase class C family)
MQNYSSNPETSMLSFAYGGGNLVSTPEDLAHFVRALFTGSILSQTSMNQMKVFHPNSQTTWKGYGLGIHRPNAFGNTATFGHDGYYTNMTDMFHSEDYGFTLVTMTNTQTGWFAIFNEMFNKIKNHIVGIKENEALSLIHIFPNPANDRITINLGNHYKNVETIISDITGKIIYKTSSGEIQFVEVSTKDFAEGIYIVKVQSDNFTGTKKFVVAK